MAYIQGQSRQQGSLFPVALEELIGADSAVRVIDAFVAGLEMADLGFAKAIPAATGRPPYDPKDLLKLYVYGYQNAVRSSRRLEAEAGRNVELMWLIDRLTPDFKTIAEFRKHNAPAIVGVCRAFVLFCREQQLFGATQVAIDGSKFAAVASRKQVFTPERIERTGAALDRDIAGYLAQMDTQDAAEPAVSEADVAAVLAALREKRAQLQALAAQMIASGESQRVSSEPEAKLMRTAHEGYQVAYNVQSVVDDQHHLIAEFAVTSQGNDTQQLEPMAQAAKEVLQSEALTVLADTGYHNAEQAEHCEQAGITPVVPAQSVVNPRGEQFYTREAFRYQPDKDTYRCPAGAELSRTRTDQRRQVYSYSTAACAGCALRSACTKAARRTILRGFHAAASERMNQRAQARPELMRRRSALVEHPFGTIKYWMGRARFLVRGISKASAEMALCVLGYNMKRVMKVLSVPVLLVALAR